ncbi:MAG: YdcF family protein [Deltaproteobacteria bacterium]
MRRIKHLPNGKKEFVIMLLVVLSICLLVVIEINIFYKGLKLQPQKADAIIVMGCAVWRDVPSPALYERIYKSFELYKNGYAKKIIATGGQGEGENITESAAIKKQLIRLGVEEKDIIEENKSRNTIENLNFARSIMEKNRLEKIIIVTNYFHIYRCSMISSDLKINATFAKAKMPDSIPYLFSSNVREVFSVVKYYFSSLFEHEKNK